MPKTIHNLAVGDLVGIPVNEGSRTRFGDTIVWKIVAKNHSGYPANSVTLITDRIIQAMAFDAKEANNPTSTTKTYGYNRYIYSNIHQWLNSVKAESWYSAQHPYDAAPISTTVSPGNHYNDWPGFLTVFPAAFADKLLETTLITARSTAFDDGGSDSFTAKMFLASSTEAGIGLENGIAEGTQFAAFTNNDSRVTYPTYHVAKNANGYVNEEFSEFFPWPWSLRSINTTSATIHRVANTSGGLGTTYPSNGTMGIRPVCNIPSSMNVSDSPNSSNVYTLLPNQAPETPASITIPATIQSGSKASIAWGVSADADGNLSGYRLERDSGNAAWTQIYQGTSKSYSDTILSNWSTVQYRVKGYDAYGEESGYTVGPTRVISKNTAPSAPAELIVPAEVRGGSAVTISWSAASDAEGNLAGYILERSLNGGSFTQVFKGLAAFYENSVSFGTSTVAYRVKAYDSNGLESAYVTSPTRTVVNNRPPEMPSQITIPEIHAASPFTISWGSATDADGNLTGYILERSIDGGSWSQIYKGSLKAYTDQPSTAWLTAQYRVRAYDALGEESANRTGGIRVVDKSQPPSAPSAPRLLDKIIAGTTLRIEWEKAVSHEGGVLSYCLERSENSGGFIPVYTGTALSFDDLVPNANTLQYRVKASDPIGGDSAYAISQAVSVVHSKPPVITGADTNLGQRNTPFSYSYSVTDPESDAFTVTELIDNQVVRMYAPTPGAEQSFAINGDTLLLLANGEHTLSIKAEDVHGLSATRVIRFSKDIPYVRIECKQPYESPSMPARASVRVERLIPRGALYAVEATNNPFDAEPVWENITTTSERGLAHVFRNKTTLSERHGLNFRISIARNGAEGECWISTIDGSFE